MPISRKPWLLAAALSAALECLLALRVTRIEMAASIVLSWGVFLTLAGDLRPALSSMEAGAKRSVAWLWCARVVPVTLWIAALLGLAWAAHALLGRGPGDLAQTEPIQARAGQALRIFPLVIGTAALLIRGEREGARGQLLALVALPWPLVTPVPDWLRACVELSDLSSWGAQKLLAACGLALGRRGPILELPDGTELIVNTHCSGLGAVMQLCAVAVLLWLVLGARARSLLWLVPLAAALAIAVNSIRIAWLALLLVQHQPARFDFWHEQRGSLIYQTISTALLLAVALPALLRRADETVRRGRAEASDPQSY